MNILMERKDENLLIGQDTLERCQDFGSAYAGQAIIEDKHVGPNLCGGVYGARPIGCLAHDSDAAAVLQNLSQGLAHHRVVVGQYYSNFIAHGHDRILLGKRSFGSAFQFILLEKGMTTWISAPFPGSDLTANVPPSSSARSLIPKIPSRLPSNDVGSNPTPASRTVSPMQSLAAFRQTNTSDDRAWRETLVSASCKMR